MLPNLKKYKVILASNSPRRKNLLAGLNIDFEVRVIDDIDESYPSDLDIYDVAEYIACKKAEVYKASMASDELLITADTIVSRFDKILGKPEGKEDAVKMLQELSDRVHEVVTGVCLLAQDKKVSFSESSAVSFSKLSEEEIEYYVEKYNPMDKAGAYGIQEWIGYVGVEAINGSFYNVMGLPIQRLYQELKNF
ncbi:Maf-like protein [Parabacteroides sp. PF5-6]|uniref:Maf-like protein n=1 Tax=Parabacteroides sp. PF5-6 TaxID=1742403 RepID=UPI00240496D0|nr:Maf-like protein [Parabacteroides sp. PF5-6]